jgi:hypothetical protein
MPNHYHLLVACPRGGLGAAMQLLQSRFTRHINRTRGADGPLFRGRYRNRVVEDDRYWMHLLAYLHLNPVVAGLAPDAAEARWTSHAAYLGRERRPDWLRTDDLLDAFGSVEALVQYVTEVQIGREPGPDGFDPADLWSRPSSAALPAPRVERPHWPWSEAAAWQTLASVTGVELDRLRHSPTGRHGGSPGRDVAFWWLPMALGVPRASVASKLGVDPAVASRAATRALRRCDEDPQVARWVERLAALVPAPVRGRA